MIHWNQKKILWYKNYLFSQFWRFFLDFSSAGIKAAIPIFDRGFFRHFYIFKDAISEKRPSFFFEIFYYKSVIFLSFAVWELNFELKYLKVFQYSKKPKNLIIFRPFYFFEFQILQNYSELHMPPESSQINIYAKKQGSFFQNVPSFHFTHKPKLLNYCVFLLKIWRSLADLNNNIRICLQ